MAFTNYKFQIKPPQYGTPPFVDENDLPRLRVPPPQQDDLPPLSSGNLTQTAGFNFIVKPPMVDEAQGGFAPNSLPPINVPADASTSNAFGNLPPVQPPQPASGSNIFAPANVANAPANVNRRFSLDQLPSPTADLPRFNVNAPLAPNDSLPPVPRFDSEKTADKLAQIENKRYGFQKDERGNILRDANGKPLYEKDRDTDHNWWDVVKSAGLGFLNGGIGGAIAGGVEGAFDRNADEKMIDGIKTARLNNTYAEQVKREDAKLGQDYKQAQIANVYADNETAATNAETRKQLAQRNLLLRQLSLTKRYKRGENPQFDARLESAGVEQPDFEPGKKLKPRFWDYATGKLMTFDDNNAIVPALTADGEEVVSGSKKEVQSGGYTVMPNVARSADATVEASRVGAFNKTGDNQNDYDTKIAGLKGKIASANARATSAKATIANLQNPQTQEDYNKKTAAEKELSAAESDAAGYQTELSNLPKPVQVQSITGSNIGNYSEAQFRKNFEGRKTPEEIEVLVREAKAQGIIK